MGNLSKNRYISANRKLYRYINYYLIMIKESVKSRYLGDALGDFLDITPTGIRDSYRAFRSEGHGKISSTVSTAAVKLPTIAGLAILGGNIYKNLSI